MLLVVSPHAIENLARLLTSHELNLDPHDLIARYVGDRDGCPHIGQRSDVAEPPIG